MRVYTMTSVLKGKRKSANFYSLLQLWRSRCTRMCLKFKCIVAVSYNSLLKVQSTFPHFQLKFMNVFSWRRRTKKPFPNTFDFFIAETQHFARGSPIKSFYLGGFPVLFCLPGFHPSSRPDLLDFHLWDSKT